MGDGIRIHQRRTPSGKEIGNRGLAAADAAGQTHNEAHGVDSAFARQAPGLALGSSATTA
jgi:hypothetical protein